MAELRLPSNSVVKKGREHKENEEMLKPRKIKIYRYDPDLDENPTIDSFKIDLSKTGP
ncbi:MAG: succinate dehydrogenase iron-sulfur subunit, partial [Rickettsia endosymbiont of Ixodes ricinus]|nr:succinate dehydrogenase iron-sulfur subunit [Rickettsia endosymbiont of Ixodes ricinus]